MKMFDAISKSGAVALACAVLSGCGREVERQAYLGTMPAVATAPLHDAIAQRGYADLGEGVFLIPGRFGSQVERELEFAQALANFRADHPGRVITREIEVDCDTQYGAVSPYPSGGPFRIDGIVLWTDAQPAPVGK